MKPIKKKVICTGANGLDGSSMIDFLLSKENLDVYGVVRRTSHQNLNDLKDALDNPNFKLITADLSDSHSLEKIVMDIKPDYFINFAAQSFVSSSWDIPELTFDINATGVIRCLEAIRKHCRHCRFFNAGSSEEISDVEYVPQDEEHPKSARSPYGASKIASHHIIKIYREAYDLYALQGILFSHESPKRSIEFVTQKIARGTAEIKKSLTNKVAIVPIELGYIYTEKDWSHVNDFIVGIWMMLNQEKYGKFPKSAGFTQPYSLFIKEYVLSSGVPHTIKDFVDKAFEIAGIKGKWIGEGINEKYISEENEEIIFVKINPKFFRPSESTIKNVGSSDLIRKDMGWKPEYDFDKLVKEMVESALSQNG